MSDQEFGNGPVRRYILSSTTTQLAARAHLVASMEAEHKAEKTTNPTENALKFLKQKPPNNTVNESGNTQNNNDSFERPRNYTGFQGPYDYRRPRDPMAADRFGEELAPDAAIWNMYLDEAQDYDNELVAGRQRSLDTLLLFAALFSAILTAFLIESKNLLQQDPADVSTALLLLIAQSQQRVELGLPVPDEAMMPVEMPNFESPMSAQWVNGIWFTALGLSLSAALIAMLGKEWLTTYLASRPRSARKLAFIRQSRLQGLEDWWALHIIALLPTLLHLSLLLFSVGLVVYLWALNVAVAVVLAGVIGATLIFYLVTTVLGAVYDFCPFVTEVSEYARMAAAMLFKLPSQEKNDSSVPSTRDLQALLWLADHARDPVIVDCSYQAMAGLRTSSYLLPEITSAQSNLSTPANVLDQSLVTPNSEININALFNAVTERFDGILAGTLESGSIEPPVSRYVTAMSGLGLVIHQSNKEASIQSWFTILTKVNQLWNSNLPSHSLSGGSFASLLIAEMNVIQYVIKAYTLDMAITRQICVPGTRVEHPVPSGSGPHHASPWGKNGHIVDMISGPTREGLLLEVRKRLPLWLDIAFHVLSAHNTGGTFIDPYLYDGLSKAVGDAISHMNQMYDLLGSTQFTSTENGFIETKDSNDLTKGWIDLPGSVPILKQSKYLAILIGSLARCTYLDSDVKVPTSTSLLKAYATLAPVILYSVAKVDPRVIAKEFLFQDLSSQPPASPRDILYIGMRYMMLTAGYLYNTPTPEYEVLGVCTDVFAAIWHLTAADVMIDPKHPGPCQAPVYHLDRYISILHNVGANQPNFPPLSIETINGLCLIPGLNGGFGAHIIGCHLDPACFSTLFYLLALSNLVANHAKGIFGMFDCRLDNIDQGNIPEDFPPVPIPTAHTPIQYLQEATHHPHLFQALVSVGFVEREGFADSALPTIVKLVQLAAGRDNPAHLKVESSEIKSEAVPGFLQALSWALPRVSDYKGKDISSPKFFFAAAALMLTAAQDMESRELIHHDFNRIFLLEELRKNQQVYVELTSQGEWEGLISGLSFDTQVYPVKELPNEREWIDKDAAPYEDGPSPNLHIPTVPDTMLVSTNNEAES